MTPFNYETITQYTLKVRVTDNGSPPLSNLIDGKKNFFFCFKYIVLHTHITNYPLHKHRNFFLPLHLQNLCQNLTTISQDNFSVFTCVRKKECTPTTFLVSHVTLSCMLKNFTVTYRKRQTSH